MALVLPRCAHLPHVALPLPARIHPRGAGPSAWHRPLCPAGAQQGCGCPWTVVGGLRRAPHCPEGQPAPGRGRPPHGAMESWDPRHLAHGHGRARGSGAGGPQPFLQQARGEDSQACGCAGGTRELSPPHPPTRRRRPRAGQPVASVPSSGERPSRPCGHIRWPRAHSRAPPQDHTAGSPKVRGPPVSREFSHQTRWQPPRRSG